jgi:ssDNA-specific exonuclease RecJ
LIFQKNFILKFGAEKMEIINNFILKSKDLVRAKRILDSSNFNKLYIELANKSDHYDLTITTREDFVRKQNAQLYIEFI